MASSSSSPTAGHADDTNADSSASVVQNIALKHDATHFVAVTASSFHVFSCEPLKRIFSSCGSSDSEMTSAAEVLAQLGLDVVNHVLITGEEVAAVCTQGHMELVETGPNPQGLCALARQKNQAGQETLVYGLPRPQKGTVQVRQSRGRGGGGGVDVRAHGSTLACLALSPDGRLLATASAMGTLVRVFGTADGIKLQEMRRGSDRADIHCMAFSPDSKWLAVTSDKATVHVFIVNVNLPSLTPEDSDGADGPRAEAGAADADTAPPPAEAVAKANKRSSLSFLGGFLPGYFSSEWSLAQFRVRAGTKYLVAFGKQPNTLLVIGMDGSFYRCRFDPEKGGEMEQLEHINFMNLSQKTLSPPNL